jgi:hypothetical protein
VRYGRRIAAVSAALGAAAWLGFAQGQKSDADRIQEGWAAVRLVDQKLDVVIGKSSARFKGCYTLRASNAVQKAVFAFPLPGDGTGEDKAAVLCDGQDLSPIPYLRLDSASRDDLADFGSDAWIRRAKERQAENEKRNRGQSIRLALNEFLAHQISADYSETAWQAHELDFAANQERTLQVDARLGPVKLADSAKDGPCYAYRIPIRLGQIWARPAGKLEVTITLREDLKAEDVILVRPEGVRREGRTLTLSLDGQEPLEDLTVVLKGKIP